MTSTERITDLDEAKILGYFESIQCAFLTKFLFLASHTGEKEGRRIVDPSRIPEDAIVAAESQLPHPLFYRALRLGNEEIFLNYYEDMMTSLFTSSWLVFEQVIKDLTSTNYSNQTADMSLNYANGKFQFDKREKKDIELFYYIRNATHHYNGAYFAYRDIDHRYAGQDFKSAGHHGEKIQIDFKVAVQMSRDLERLTIKAWQNAKCQS